MSGGAWAAIIGGGCCLLTALATIAMLGMVAMGRRCQAEHLGTCGTLVIRFREHDEEVTLDDPERIREIAGFLTDEPQPSLPMMSTWVELCFIESETRKYTALVTRMGWCWPYGRPASRQITDATALSEAIEAIAREHGIGGDDEPEANQPVVV